MINPVSVPLGIDRAKPRVFRIVVHGADLRGADAAWRAQIRLRPDTPGEPLLDLPKVTDLGNVTGIRLVAFDGSGPMPVSTLDVQIPGTVVWPDPAEAGDTLRLAWDFFVGLPGYPMEKWVYGPVYIYGTVTKGDVPSLVALPLSAPGDATFTLGAAALTVVLGADLKPLADRIDALTAETGNRADVTDQAVTALQERAGDVEQRATTLEQHAGAVDGHLGTLDGEITSLGDRATAVEQHAVAVDGEITALDTRSAASRDALASIGAVDTGWPRGAFRAWRLKIASSAAGYDARVAGLQFRATAGGADQATGGTPFGSPSSTGAGAAYAFDGDPNTTWIGDNPFPVYIGYLFASAVSVGEFAVQGDGGGHAAASPIGMTLQHSADTTTGFDGTWIDAWNPPAQSGWTDNEQRVFADPLTGQTSKRVVLGAPGSADLFTAKQGGGYEKLPSPGGGSGSAKSANTQALIAAIRTQSAFPILPAAAADTPAVTIGAASAMPNGSPFIPAVVGGSDNPLICERFGPTTNANGFSRVRGSNRSKPGQPVSYAGGFSAKEFVHTGTTLEFSTYAGGGSPTYRLIVDGKVAWAAAPTLSGSVFYKFVFPTSRKRLISFETGNLNFGGVTIGSGDTLTATPNSYPMISWLGDSFIDGTGSDRANGALSAVAVRALGCAGNIMSAGGTGIIADNDGKSCPYTDPTRIADWLMAGTGITPALGVLPGSQNDNGVSYAGFPTLQAAIAAGTATLVEAWLSANPAAPLIVVGPWVSSSQDVAPPSLQAYYIRDAMQQVADHYRRREVYFLDQLVEELIAGQSDIAGSQANYYAIPTDHLHPSQPGHDLRGTWHARKIEQLIMASFT